MSSKYRSDYLCRVRYRNTLPPLPFAPKLLTMPSLQERHAEYQSLDFEDKIPFPLQIDQSYSIPFDRSLVEYLDAMETNPEEITRAGEEIAEEDRILLTPPTDEQQSNRIKMERRPNVSWLRRVDTLGLPKPTQPRKKDAVAAAAAAAAASHNTKRPLHYTWEECQTKLLAGFQPPDVEALRHPRTKCKAKRVVPVLPNYKCDNAIYTIVNFGADPADEKRLAKRRLQSKDDADSEREGIKRLRSSAKDATDRGILRPITNPHDPDDSYLIWFLPDKEGTARLVQEKANVQEMVSDAESTVGEEPITFESVREYLYNHDNEQQYMLLRFVDDGESSRGEFNVVKSRMTASKKRAVSKQYQYRYLEEYEKPNILNVTYEQQEEEQDQ
ncbi:RNA polymerase II-associated [Zychaea mexicana]|uniref:RNA polymerase II-associated n=1 Tax=Zychaea mexicana TaxID=64656 RepID=UPI0022FE553E|nr:RNA polymerase II-associated [Zychaea mexicana]KAI9493333.1 RNA polymerase II-associated [Zychaea mexicana]